MDNTPAGGIDLQCQTLDQKSIAPARGPWLLGFLQTLGSSEPTTHSSVGGSARRNEKSRICRWDLGRPAYQMTFGLAERKRAQVEFCSVSLVVLLRDEIPEESTSQFLLPEQEKGWHTICTLACSTEDIRRVFIVLYLRRIVP